MRFSAILLCLVLISFLIAAEADQLPNFDRLWNWNDPAASEAEFTRLLAQVNKDDNGDYYAELLTQIARAQGLQGKFDEAKATLLKVQEMLPIVEKQAEVRYLLEMGRVHNSSGDAENARGYFLKAWQIASEMDILVYALDAAHMMGIVSPPQEQVEWGEKAIKIAENSDQPAAQGWLGPLYNNTGWTYHDMGNYEKALELWEKGLAFRQKIGSLPEIMIAKWTVARAYRSLGKNDDALKLQEALLEEINANYLPQDGYVYEELAELYLIKKNSEKAKEYFSKAYELLSQDSWMMENEKERMERMNKLSK